MLYKIRTAKVPSDNKQDYAFKNG